MELVSKKIDVEFTDNKEINLKLKEISQKFLKGDKSGVDTVIKTAPTNMMLASYADVRNRYLVNHDNPNALTTNIEVNPLNEGKVGVVSYVGVDKDGKPIAVTGEEAVNLIREDSVIMQNPDPICLPKDHPLMVQAREKAKEEGKSEEEIRKIQIPVKGRYHLKERMVKDLKTGEMVNAMVSEFEVDMEHGDTFLYNEYVSDLAFVGQPGTYNVSKDELLNAPHDGRPIPEGGESPWITRTRKRQSYAFKIEVDNSGEPIKMYTEGNKKGVEIIIEPGGYFVFDNVNKDGTFVNARGVEASQFAHTYANYNEFVSKINY